jgi:cell wall-associated NlpC family hydrolase
MAFLSGCSMKNSAEPEQVTDLKTIPQNVSVYTKNIDKGKISTETQFEKAYFSPWNIVAFDIPLDKAMWAYNVFTPKKSYGENLQHLNQSFFDKMLKKSNFKKYATVNKRALTLRHLNIRAFPTLRPLLKNPNEAGEGFPFDYLQNSTIEANKPLFVSHYSKDKEWVFVKSSFAYGWVKTRDIVFIDKKYTDMWQKAQQVFLTKDNQAVYSQDKDYLFRTHIGMMLALISDDNESNTVLTVDRYRANEPYYDRSILSKQISHNGLLAFNAQNINAIIKELLKVNYGWGGIYGQRDCSSTMRDFFAPFGVWLPRNSYKQSLVGQVINLEDMSNQEKITAIKKYGVAFETLLYRQGHIVLYAGIYHNKIIIFQNLWGIKTQKDGKDGRFIIGRSIFSTLEVGKNLRYFDKRGSLLSGLKSMNIVTNLE